MPRVAAPAAWRHRWDLLANLVRRDLRLRYRRSALGVLWTLLLPLAQVAVLVLVFQFIVPLNITAYPLFVFSGLLPWTWFSTSLLAATGVFIENRDLLRRPGFDPALLVVATTISNLVMYLAALPVLFLLLAYYGRPPRAAIALFPLLVLVQASLTIGLGLVGATLNVFYRDVCYVVSIVLLLVFYLTPVFYQLPANAPGLDLLFALNPLATLVTAYRGVLVDGTFPPWPSVAAAAAMGAAALVLGRSVSVRMHARVIDRL
jgi:ABC-type polysaccharide/polyol phosphate export permease